MRHPLDDPVWSALSGRHDHFARRAGAIARYPADVAPFAALDPAADNQAAQDLAPLLDVGETVLFVGRAPAVDGGYCAESIEHIAQMTGGVRIDVRDGLPVIRLREADAAAVHDLIARVYPHFFRPRTMAMGRYFGIYDAQTLTAIIGERMRCDGHVELSAICTDPRCTGRGLAQRLVATLANDILDRGDVPFLHVSHRNARAKSLYEHLGFRRRRDVALTAVRRLG